MWHWLKHSWAYSPNRYFRRCRVCGVRQQYEHRVRRYIGFFETWH